jgi:CRISPR-associated endonuclease Cas1
MQAQGSASPIPVSSDGVMVVDGYGIKIHVERGRLVVSDGLGRMRREARFSRATHGLRRVVLLGHTGFVTLEAVRWLGDVGVSMIHLDKDGQLLLVSAKPRSDDARLRRAQARAFGTPCGIELARALLRHKLDGQSRVAGMLGASEAVLAIEAARVDLEWAHSPAELMVHEAAAAIVYWGAWSTVPIQWARKDEDRVPPHWRTFGTRTSPLSGSPRLAATPGNALLNFGYDLLEAETRLACLTVGLDPGLGILHADQRSRDSFVLDVMEATRPAVDETVLELIQRRSFRASDWHETRAGAVRILAPLTHEVARSASGWSRAVAPSVEMAARAFADASDSIADRLATPLSGDNRSAGRASQRVRERREAATQAPFRSCVQCGSILSAPRRRYCDTCRPVIGDFQASGTEALAAARANADDPAHGGDVARIRGEKWRARRRLEAEWEREHDRPDSSDFRERIWPLIHDLPTRRIVEVTGMTRAYCSKIKRGELVPHPRWWEALRIAGAKPGIFRSPVQTEYQPA